MPSVTRGVFRSILAVLFLLLPALCHAQEAVIGTITDSTGGVLPGVVVRAVHQESGNSVEAVTDKASGVYRLPVRIGSYTIVAELPGFTVVKRTGVELLAGQQGVVNIQLTPSRSRRRSRSPARRRCSTHRARVLGKRSTSIRWKICRSTDATGWISP